MYTTELHKASPHNTLEAVEPVTLPAKKKGRPFLLGDELDRQVQAYIMRLRDAGCVVNSTIVIISTATGMVKKHNSNLLATNGGPLTLKKSWANCLLSRMGMVRRSTGKSKLSPSEFDEVKSQMLIDIKCNVVMEDIPPELIVNWDQTSINYVPQSQWPSLDLQGWRWLDLVTNGKLQQYSVLL